MVTAERIQSIEDAITEIAPLVREHADAAERERRLADPVVRRMVDLGLFRHMVPASLGGGEIDPLSWYRGVEEAARVDGSFGWCLFLSGTTGMIGQTLNEEDSVAIVGDPEAVLAGTIFPFGKAVASGDGFGVSGRWGYASGCQFATWMVVAALVHDGDALRMTASGTPDVRLFLTRRENVQIIDTWDVSGLAATGSHDIVLEDVLVPAGYTIPLAPMRSNSYYQGAPYRLPFMVMFAWPIAAVALGIAQHAVDEVLALARTKVPAGLVATPLFERPLFHFQIAEAVAQLNSSRAWLHDVLRRLWELAEAGGPADISIRNEAQLAASNAVRKSCQAVDLAYLAGGGSANYRSSPLQRCLRDVHAVTQHAIVAPATWETAGAVLAGMPPPNPLLLL